MILTRDQLEKVKAIIARRYAAVTLRIAGAGILTLEERRALTAAGIDPDKVTVDALIRQAFMYGHVAASTGVTSLRPPVGADPERWTRDQYLGAIAAKPIELSEEEVRAADLAAMSAAQHCRGLGNRVDVATGREMIEADRSLRAEMTGGIRDATTAAIRARKSIRELRSDLGWLAKDWTRDFDRIAVTELMDAHNQGRAAQLHAAHGDPWVFKQPRPDACKDCARLYLGPDGMPRLFRLSELEAMGHNAGRPRSEWAATVSPIHPHCRCSFHRMPEGWGFDENGDMVPGGKLGVRYGSAEDAGEERGVAGRMDETRPRSQRGGEEIDRDPLAKSARAAGAKIDLGNGLVFRVEVPAGGIRKWKDRNGKSGETRMLYPYGDLEGTMGPDGDPYDAYLGPLPSAPIVYVVHQVVPGTDEWDEDKAMIGFATADRALDAYLAHRSDGTAAFGGITALTITEFGERVKASLTGSLTKGMGVAGIAAVQESGGHQHMGHGVTANLLDGTPPRRPKVVIKPPMAAFVARMQAPVGSPQVRKHQPPPRRKVRDSTRLGSLHAIVAEGRERIATTEIAEKNRRKFQAEAERRAAPDRFRNEPPPDPDEQVEEEEEAAIS